MDAVVANLPRSIEVYELALEGLTRVNEWIYRKSKVKLPSIYAGGVRYQREVGEVWRHVADVLHEGWGDCEDLACALAGWLRANGDRRARVVVKRTGPKMTHALVRHGNGKIEDPSRKLGMGRETEVTEAEVMGNGNWGGAGDEVGGEEYDDADYEQAEGSGDDDDDDGWEHIGADVSPRNREVTWTVDRTPTGWRGTVRVPLDMGRAMLVSRTSETKGPSGKKEAASSALSAASKVLDSPFAQALIPPQAKLALSLVKNPAVMKGVNKTIGALRHLF
jgi:hypothetical protein